MNKPDLLERNTAVIPNYQVDTRGMNIPIMVESSIAKQRNLRSQALGLALTSSVWSEQYPSLISSPYRRIYRQYSQNGERVQLFSPDTGAIIVPSDALKNSPLGAFFTQERIFGEGDFVELRGSAFFPSLAYNLNIPEKGIQALSQDVEEGLDTIAPINRGGLNSRDYLLYLGILDYIKMDTINTFHALTYPERTGIIPSIPTYKWTREDIRNKMISAGRAFYQMCLGQEFDSSFRRELKEKKGSPGISTSRFAHAFEQVKNYLSEDYVFEHPFTYPEAVNPITILLGAHEAARKNPDIDTIIGIPSGGTEVAIAVQLMYENIYPDKATPKLLFVPLSFHYKGKNGIASVWLNEILRKSNVIEGRRVLIVDDNSNTGSTLQSLAESALEVGASNVNAHLAELDPGRVLAKSDRERPLGDWVVNMEHPDLQTAMGLTGSSDFDGDDLRRKIIKRRIQKIHRASKKQRGVS